MKTLLLILALTISLNCFSQTEGKNFIDYNYIEVTGKAEMEVVPNEIYLKIIINEKDYKGKELEDIEKEMIVKLKNLGIDVSKDLAIKDMMSNLKNYWLKGKQIQSSKEYQLLVYKTLTAGRVFQELESIGISNISIDRLNHSDIEKFRLEVKEKAVVAAREKAIVLTNAIGQSIKNAIYIKELDYGVSPHLRAANTNFVVQGYYANVPGSKQAEIEIEKIKLQYSVLVRFGMHYK
ncbi:MAG: SIMPL domain-containing protein [Carboxylicivirga sp.]|jgi:uncharacterized protein YggE|nr:SIMPL domain-containing protein [Carboxylicivirga sp.]